MFCLKKKILISFTPLRRSVLRRPGLLLRVTSQRRQAALPPDPVGFESRFPLQQNSTLMKGELGCLFPALVWEARGDNQDSRRRVTHALAHACPSARVPCALCRPRRQARGVHTVGNEDAVHDTAAVISFSLKCLKGGVGRWPGSNLAPPRPRQATCQRAPHLTLVQMRLQNPDVLPSPQPAPRSRCPPPTPRHALSHLATGPARTGPYANECLPWTPGPRGLKGSQGKPVPPDAGEAVATHSTKCWHLHPYPGRPSADAAGGDLPFPTASWLGMFLTAKDLVRGIKTFFSRYLIFVVVFSYDFFFLVCCTAV